MAGAMATMDGHHPRSAALARNWWAIALRGVVALALGIAAFLLPFTTIASLALLFAIYLLIDGVFAVVAGARAAARHERWGLLILEGVAGVVAGFVAVTLPALTVIFVVALLGIWSVVSGALMLAAAFRLAPGHGRRLLIVGGVLSIAWGLLLYRSPVTGTVVLAWWLGGYAVVFGLLLIALALRLRSRHVMIEGAPATL